MRVGEVCTREVVFCESDATLAQIAQLMREHHVGDLIVARLQGEKLVPVGIVTDRDLVIRVLAGGRSPGPSSAGELMSSPLVQISEDEIVYEAIGRMRAHGIRRLPVVDAGGFLVGMLTLDDVIEFLAEELTQIAAIVPGQVRVRRPS